MRIHPSHRAALAVASLAVTAAILPLTTSAQTPAASSSVPASAAIPAPPPTAAQQKDMFIALGWFISQESHITDLGLTPAEMDEFETGMKAAMDGKELPVPKETAGQAMQDYLESRAKDHIKALAAAQAAAAEKFFAGLDKDANVKKTSSGLYYTITSPGADTKAKKTDTATVKYKGTLIDGTVFDQTDGTTTTDMDLARVIPGWSEGVQLIGKGGKIKLYIPAKLAYGENPPPQLPPNATLIFEVEVVDVKATPPPATPSSTTSAADMDAIKALLGTGTPPPSGK